MHDKNLKDTLRTLAEAGPEGKAMLYKEFGLKLTYPARQVVSVEADLPRGDKSVSEGRLHPQVHAQHGDPSSGPHSGPEATPTARTFVGLSPATAHSYYGMILAWPSGSGQ